MGGYFHDTPQGCENDIPLVNALEIPTRKHCASLAWVGPMRVEPRLLVKVVTQFDDSDDFLLASDAFDFHFYVVHLVQRGVRGIDLIRFIRRSSTAGILALSNQAGDDFVAALDAGADMVLSQDAPAEHLSAAINAVQRRQHQAGPAVSAAWTLFEERAVLQAPDGTQIPLSDGDLAIMRCFAAANGGRVDRQVLMEQLWGKRTASMDNALHATLFRLRKRIEQAGQTLVPVHAVSKVGYEFRAPLVRA